MDFDLSEPFTELFLLLRREILIPEKDDTTLGNQERELILLLRVEVFELQTLDFGTDMRRQVSDFSRGTEQVLLGLVGTSASVDVFALLVADVDGILQEEGS